MRFDPKLIPTAEAPTDADGEIDLPPDLLELASQLRDDASFLAERFPAEPTVVSPRAPARRTSRPWWMATGVAAAALLVGAWVSLPGERGAESDVVATPPVAAPDHAERVAAVDPHPQIKATSPTSGPRIERLPWAPVPAMTEVSGPELEGLLDLWQNDEHPTEVRISI